MREMEVDRMALAKRFKHNSGHAAIAYYRYSSEAQRDASIAQQREEAHRYAKQHGYHIVKEYEDRAITGSRDDRPGFQQMLEEVKYLKVAYLILWKTDRLSRDKYDSVLAKKIIRDAGTEIVYVAEAMPEDEAERILIESIQEGLAQHFLIQHTKNVTRGLRYNAENCLYNGVKMLGYIGKPDCPYEIDPETSIIVKKIFSDYAEGVPMKEIVNDLTKAGIKSVKGNDFTINSLRHILHNRAYLGEYKWGEYVIPEGMPRIISDELYEKVQARLAKNKHGGNRKVMEMHPETIDDHEMFWLTDYMVCGDCGGTMHGVSGTSEKGVLHYYYVCNNRAKKQCKNTKYIPQKKIEKIVLYILNEIAHDSTMRIVVASRAYEYYKSQIGDNKAYIKTLEANIAEVDKKLKNLLDAVESGIFNNTTAQRMKDLEERKSLLIDELSIEKVKQQHEIRMEDILKYYDSVVLNLDNPFERRKFLDMFVEKIYIYGNKIVISLFYSNDKREIDIKEFTEFIENREYIMKMLNSGTFDENVAQQMLEEDMENGDFFLCPVL